MLSHQTYIAITSLAGIGLSSPEAQIQFIPPEQLPTFTILLLTSLPTSR